MKNSRDISELHPTVMKLCQKFIAECAKENIGIIITSTYRDNESQALLYAQGRTKPGQIVTNAKPGNSYHNYRVAFDFAPQINGKIPWKDTALFTRCGIIAENCGLEWAGRWKEFQELAHCQYTNGLKIADFKAGKTL